MTIAAGTQIGSYKILSPLGAGGMGEVYLAEDTRLKRKVALKLLPAELTSDAERVRRFEQEAQAASALNHPNIITVYDIGECEGGRFIVMELVAGRTLRAVIAEDNSLETVLALSQQMAKALSAAHAAGITHRDIKPDNIMVRDDGYVKVLDFGLARLRPSTESDSEEATLAQQTMPGTVMGTVAYMSPEQARGERVSHPSDIFALGIVLYELATGRHPFKAETLIGYLHAITLQEPAPLTKWKPELPTALNALILRMLSKDASQRPTASEVAQTLQDIERRGATVKPQSNEDATMMLPVAPTATSRADEGFWVAVLPFKWRGANAELEALAEGLSEDIVTGLSRFSYLRVIARGSTLRFTSETSDVRAIGKELGARYVMEGSLRQAGSQLRVAVQLVDASTGAHLWTETYSRSFSPEVIFEIQDDLVPRIVSTVADWYGALPHSMSEAIRLKAPDQLSPYEAVLRGFGYFERIAPEEHAAVRAGLERAVEQAPGNADGWALLSMIYGEEHRFGFNARPDPLGRSLAVARRAVDAGHANHFAWLALAQALFFRKEFAAFREAAERAIALNPMDGSTLEYLAHLIAFAGDWERGCALAEQARQLNPNHPGWYWTVHFLDAYRKGDYETARTCIFKNCMRGGGAQLFEAALLTALYGQLGEREAADKLRQTVLAAKPDFLLTLRSEFAKWYLPELVEQLMDGLRKAGLAIDDEAPTITLAPNIDSKQTGEIFAASATLRHTVGREPERNELRAAFNAAKGGRGSLLCVAGEPGIGKTTLVEDFLAELAAKDQCTIARGRCSERLAGTEAYLPLLEALESLMTVLSTAFRRNAQEATIPPEGGTLNIAQTMKQIAPTWYAQVLPLAGDSEESVRLLAEVKAASQERMKRELAAFLQAVATPQPLVLFFDDLHWADVSTIDLLSFLASKFDALRVLIVTTYRPSDMLLAKHPFLQIKPDLQARGYCRELSLEFLTEAEIADYLTLEFPRHAFPPDFARLIHAKTEGSPLFMADLVRYLRDRNVIAQTSGSWKLEQTLPDIERELPESVRGMIERKIAQLSEEDHKLLSVASVQGYEFDSAVVAKVLDIDADEVEERLEKLERVFAFVKLASEAEFPNRTLTLKYHFVHVLYQNTLYASLRVTRKVALSRTVAEIIEDFYSEQRDGIANELALLWESARDYTRAADYFRRAAQHAVQVFASQESVALARRGIALLRHLPDNREQRTQELFLQVVLGNSLMATQGFAAPEVEETYARARELCQELDDTPHLLPVIFGVYAFHFVRANLRQAYELAREFLSRAEQQDDPAVLAGHRIVGMPLLCMGELKAARERFEVPVSRYVPDEHRFLTFLYGHDVGMASNINLGVTLWLLGYPDTARKHLDECLRLAREIPHAHSQAYALYHSTSLRQFCREQRDTFELAEATIALATEQGLTMWLAWAAVLRGWALSEQGNVEEGIGQIRHGLESARTIKADLYQPYYLCLLAEAQSKIGQLEEGLATLKEAQRFVAKNEERYWESEVHRLRGELLRMKSASSTEVETCFQQALAIARRQQAKSLELRAATSCARLWQQQGKTAEARQMLAEIYGWFTEGFDTADLQEAKALLEELH